MSFPRVPLCVSALLLATLTCVAQQPPAQPAPLDNDFVQKQFGTEFTLVPKFEPLMADLDGDNIEDAVIVAKAKNPLIDEASHSYKVLDPYDSFFGVGDPKITSQFGAEDPDRRGLVLLIIHGAGSDAWRAETPKAKFVIINLPFRQVSIKRIQIRKKLVSSVYAEEAGGSQMTSVIFFDGKKYKYEPMGSSMQ
jgi:hypothetical protein